MQFYTFYKAGVPKASLPQLFRVMRITAFLILVTLLQVSASSYSQQLTMQKSQASLKEIFTQINIQTGYDVVVSSAQLKNTKKVSVSFNKTAIQEVLDQVLKNQNLSYSISDKTIVITEKKEEPSFLDKMIARFQRIDIKGLVVDSTGNPIAGATVKVKGFKQSTTTDNTGRFGLANVEDKATIVISFLGFETIELPANGNFTRVVLSVVTSDLDEVNIVNKGYYQTKKDLETGNVARITAKEIGQQPVSNPLAALQGRVPGLLISQTTGAPGSAFKVQLRGQSSLIQGSDPLFVIDGVQYNSKMTSTNGGSNGSLNPNMLGGSPLNFINISDIETIDVLKDADATAIYGSRGAAGVILITTKKGKNGTTKIDLNAYSGFGRITGSMDLLNTEQYLTMRREAYKNDGVAIPTVPTPGAYDLTFWDQSRNTDWQKELIGKTAKYNDVQLSMSGGAGNTQYRLGGGFHKESTVYAAPGADQKISGQVSLTTASTNQKLKADLSVKYLDDDNTVVPAFLSDVVMQLAPNSPAIYRNGALNWEVLPSGASTWANPFAQTKYIFLGKTNNLISNLSLEYSVIKNLAFRSSFNYNSLKTEEFLGVPKTATNPTRASSTNSANYLNSSNIGWVIEPQLDYNFKINDFAISALIGSTFQQNQSRYTSTQGRTYTDDSMLTNPQAAGTLTNRGFATNNYKYNALYSRVNLTLKDRYLINLTARRDGSSRFGPANQFANFGAVGVAWVLSEESLIKDNISFLSFAKLRGSYGSTGSDQLPDYGHLNLYSISTNNYLGNKGLTATGHSNPYLQWEKTVKAEVGADLRLFRDHLNLSAVYSKNESSNQLLSAPLSLVTGFPNIDTNLPAKIENTNWEFVVGYTNQESKNVKWSTNLNFTLPKNKLTELEVDALSFYKIVFPIGQPLGISRAFRSAGVNPSTGTMEFYNKAGSIINVNELVEEDRTVFINTAPTLYGGLQNSIQWKQFNFSFFVQYVKQKARGFYGNLPGSFNISDRTAVLNRWQKTGDVTNVQKFTQAFDDTYIAQSLLSNGDVDITYEDASFVRLKNASISWNCPIEFSQRLKIQNLRLYAQGQNLLTFSKFSGYDPETRSTQLPPLKVFTIGLQTSF
ncbi:SusC/RagA family TonB-linked outer membrane protein [Pedobacter sp. PWIIR3]